MHRLLSASAALVTLLAAASASAQPAPVCGPEAVAVFEPGCEGPGRLTCSAGASLPALSQWCTCDGRTVQSSSMAPPVGVRYRFEGPCEVAARFELTDERSAANVPSGRVVVMLSVGGTSREVARLRGPCAAAAAGPGELARVACARGAAPLAVRRRGDAVVVTGGARELARVAHPAGQRLRVDPPRRF